MVQPYTALGSPAYLTRYVQTLTDRNRKQSQTTTGKEQTGT